MSATTARRIKGLLLALSGLGAGLLNGLLGAAGGILLVAVLPRLAVSESPRGASLLLPPPLARRDTLATVTAVMIPVSGVSWFFYQLRGIAPPSGMLPLLILPAVLGGMVGAKLLGRLSDRVLRKLFAALVVVSGARMIF